MTDKRARLRRATFITLSLLLLCVISAFAATFDWQAGEYLGEGGNDTIQVPERPAFVYDNNVTVSEGIIQFSSDANDPGVNVTFMSTNENNGRITLTVPTGYLNMSLFRLTNYITLIANNISKPSDKIVTTFRFNITNVNDPPSIINRSPTASSLTLLETQSQNFSVNYTDIDPTNDTITVNWTVNGALLFSEQNNSYSNFTFNTNYSSAGTYRVNVSLYDGISPVGFSWLVQVNNSNLFPYFTNRSPATVSPQQILVDEGDSTNLIINYTDPDQGWPGPLEFSNVTAHWLVDGVEWFNTTLSNGSNYTLATNFSSVLPPLTSRIHTVQAIINDSNATNTTTWLINVSNVNQNPSIINITYDGTIYSSGQTVLNVQEGTNALIGFTTEDIDDNIDTETIYLNGLELITTNETTVSWNYNSQGTKLFNFTVNDTGGLNDHAFLYVDVVNNIAPTLANLTILNSTGGTYYQEGDMLNITVDATDNNSNMDTVRIFLNDTVIATGTSVIYNLNLSERGSYNITILANDTEPLTARLYNDTIVVASNDQAPSIDLMRYDTGLLAFSGQVINASEGEVLNLSFIASDLNGNGTLVFPEIRINGTANSGYEYLWSIGFDSFGLYPINISVNDTSGLRGTDHFFVNVTDNMAPNITDFTIFNSTGGTTYFEGDLLNITFNCTDIDSNAQTRWTLFDADTLYSSNASQAIHNFTFALNYTVGGSHVINAYCNDTEGLSTNISQQVTIQSLNIPPVIVNFTFTNASGTFEIVEGNLYTLQEASFINISLLASDADGNGTITSNNISFNGTPVNSTATQLATFLNQTDYNSQAIYNVTGYVEDSGGLNASRWFLMRVVDNVRPQVHNVTIFNITGGTFYAENMTLNITINATDNNSNINLYRLERDSGLVGFGANQQLTIGFDDDGWTNFTGIVTDDEGLQHNFTQEIFINITYRAPNITNYTINDVPYVRDAEIFFQEGQALTFNITYGDPDNDIDATVLLRNGTLFNTSFPNTWTTQFGDSGNYNMTAIVNDTRGMSTNWTVLVRVIDNELPSIDTTTIFNSTAGTNYSEGDLLNITFNATDSNDNIDSYLIYLNGTIVNTSQSYFTTLNFSQRGWYNVTFFVNDTEGFNDTNSTLIYVEPTEITPYFTGIFYFNGTPQSISRGETVSAFEGTTVVMSFTDADINGNTTIIARNITRNGVLLNNSPSYTRLLNYTSSGQWIINLTTLDESGLTNMSYFFLNVTDNTQPTITSSSVLNSTGGSVFEEGDYLIANMTFVDNQSNSDVFYIEFDGVRNTTLNWRIPLGFDSRGDYNVTFFVNDTEGLNDTIKTPITIIGSEQTPTITLARANNGTVLNLVNNGNASVFEGKQMIFSFTPSDPNGAADIHTVIIYQDGSPLKTQLGSGPISYSDFTGFSDAGTHAMQYFVNDTTGFSATLNFTYNITNNTRPTITSYNITNSTGGTTYFAGDTIDIGFSYRDNESNHNVTRISFNGGVISYSNATSYYLNYTLNGTYNVTFFVNDSENLQTIQNVSMIVQERQLYPRITQVNATVDAGSPQTIAKGATVVIGESSNITINFTAADQNGNNTLQFPRILINRTLVSTTQGYRFVTNFSSAGTYVVNLSINDTSSPVNLVNRTHFFITVNDNDPPLIATILVTNSTGGSTYLEGDILTVRANATDVQDNIANITILRNGTLYCFNSSDSCSASQYYNYSARGDYNFTAIVYDDEGLSASDNLTITIDPVEVNPTIGEITLNASASGTSYPTNGATVVVQEGESIKLAFVAGDLNGNGTLVAYTIRENGVPASVTQNHTKAFSFTDAGQFIYNFTARDSTAREGSAEIKVNVTNNVPPEILSVNISNATGGTAFSENTVLRVNFTYRDNNSNIDNVSVYLNGTLIGTGNASYTLPYSTGGTNTLRIYVSDLEGLNDTNTTNIFINSTEAPPVISAVVVDSGYRSQNATDAGVVNVNEGSTVTFTYAITDPTGNPDNNSISINGTTLGQSGANITFPFGGVGLYNISIYANDTTALEAFFNFTLNITDNLPPVILNLTMLNSSNGTTLFGGGLTHINVTVNDTNIATYNITFNGSVIGNSSYFNYTIPYSVRGNQTLYAIVYDAEDLTDNTSINITVTAVEVAPVITEGRVSTTIVNESDTVIDYTASSSVRLHYSYTDSNGNETVNVTRITVRAAAGNTTYNSSNMTYTLPSGGVVNVTYYVEDQAGFNDSLNFRIAAISPTPTPSPSSNSGGGGGGGGGGVSRARPTYADVQIDGTEPIVALAGESIVRTLTIRNTGDRTVTNLTLKQLQAIPGVDVEILDYEKTLGGNGSVQVQVRITNRNASGDFEIKLAAEGQSGTQLSVDEATIFVNAASSSQFSDGEFNQTLFHVSSLVHDNTECLEFADMVEEAKRKALEGSYDEAQEMLQEARERCFEKSKRPIDKLQALIIKPSTEFHTVIIWIILGVLSLILAPSLYVLFNRMKKKKVHVDEKEQEIEQFLKEFYE